jgi:transketolase
MNSKKLEKIARLIRYYILVSTTRAGSGHPTSSLSAVELMTALLFGGTFRYFVDRPEHPNNDRIIFSKGHASPLFYSLWAAAGKVSEEEMLTYRKFSSPLEGHPTPAFRYAEAATGSLGQGLAMGVGEALNAKYVDKLPYRTYILLGDSEMAEGSQWESIQIAAHYGLDNLVGILDVNRLGQRGETMYGHDTSAYEKRVSAFGWETIVLEDGHSLPDAVKAYEQALRVKGKPVMIIARTIKGKGVSFVEDVDGMHGMAIGKDRLDQALKEIGPVDKSVRGEIATPQDLTPPARTPAKTDDPSYPREKPVATRNAYGNALKRIFPAFPGMVVLDGEVSNSTKSDVFKEAYPDRFFEMYIAEQNMAGAALGFSRRGKIPFVSTFAAFHTRAFDQARMSQYSDPNIKFCGSHAGVSIGQDGPSQMGLEDIAMFRSLNGCVVLYPSDPYATERLVEEAAKHRGLVYIRTNRPNTPILYGPDDSFRIGGSMTLRKSDKDVATVIAAGVTLHETLAAYEELLKDDVRIRVIDLYSVQPLDEEALFEAARSTGLLITVEDHYGPGGLGEAVRSALALTPVPVHSLAVKKIPKSGTPEELLEYEEISKNAIVRKVKESI